MCRPLSRDTLTVLKRIVQIVYGPVPVSSDELHAKDRARTPAHKGGFGLIQLNYRDSKPIYEQIKDGFRKLIISNSISANEKLPSVRELASSLAINPNTIQKAYRDLENDGYIYTIAGKGTFVAERREVVDSRQHELLEEFDEIVAELYFLSVRKTDLVARIDSLTEGGKQA